MKKRLPLIAVFVCAIAVFLVLLFMPKAEVVPDSDNDGFADNIDQCIDKPSKSNNGCPDEELPQAENKEDRDGDGYFLTNLQGEADPNDSDPCVPKKNCPICDLDKDGLTLREEQIKKTDPNKVDTDGDGISDNIDACATEYGHGDNNGCKILLSLDFKVDNYGVVWNNEINEYASSISLEINDVSINLASSTSSLSRSEIMKKMCEYYPKNIRKGQRLTVRLNTILKDPKAISLTGNSSGTLLSTNCD